MHIKIKEKLKIKIGTFQKSLCIFFFSLIPIRLEIRKNKPDKATAEGIKNMPSLNNLFPIFLNSIF